MTTVTAPNFGLTGTIHFGQIDWSDESSWITWIFPFAEQDNLWKTADLNQGFGQGSTNHPNNFIDSLLVGGALRRKVHYLATAALFRHPLVARFLRACGAIPVYRRQDDPDKMDRNLGAFEACFKAFGDGRLVAIYPEGTTHAEVRVQRIKTGAARLALGYEAERPGALRVVPVGLKKGVGGSLLCYVVTNDGVSIELMQC